MKNKIFASTGAFIGRANGFDHNYIKEKAPEIFADGFELMLYSAWYGELERIMDETSAFGLYFPVVHFDKTIGIRFAENTAESIEDGKRDFLRNIDAANAVGAKKAVFHLWGGAKSDSAIDDTVKLVPWLCEKCAERGIELLIENIPATYNGPLNCWKKIHKVYPDAKFIYDTRFGEFHGESYEIFRSELWQAVHHIHISSFNGGMNEFGLLRPILHPGEGVVDLPALRAAMPYYEHTVTLESPVLSAEGVADTEKLNRSIEYLRKIF